MQLKEIYNPIAKYHYREDKIRKVAVKQVNLNVVETDVIIYGHLNSYLTQVKIINPKHFNSETILIDCECESFKYEFAFANKDHLLFPKKYKDIPPREKNIYRLPGVCKHLYALGRFIFINKNKFYEKIKGELK